MFRLASSEEVRLVESSQALVGKLNSMSLATFSRSLDREKQTIAHQGRVRCEPDLFYKERFIRMVGVSSLRHGAHKADRHVHTHKVCMHVSA